MFKPDPIYNSKIISHSIDKIAKSNIESQSFDNSIETSKGEEKTYLFGPILVIIAFGAIVGLSIYFIKQYEEENRTKSV